MAADNSKALRFPCECVSGLAGGFSVLWADIAKHRLLPNGTKEQILNLVAEEPRTISQLAQTLELAVPSVHTHVNDMVKSELLRESEEYEKRHPTERYYEPNFLVFKAEECDEFRGLCEEMAQQVAALFDCWCVFFVRVFGRTSLADHGWQVSDVTQCL